MLSVLPTLFGLSMVVFGVTYLIPGDPALIMAGTDTSPDAVARLRENWGLDQPLHVRYIIWLLHVLQGNLGESYFSRQTVLQLVGGALPITAELAALALLVAVAIALPTGIVSAVRSGSVFDVGAAAIAFVGLSIPGFWLGIMLIYLFGVQFQVLPAGGFSPLSDGLIPNLKSMLLPAVALGTFTATQLMRYLRGSSGRTPRGFRPDGARRPICSRVGVYTNETCVGHSKERTPMPVHQDSPAVAIARAHAEAWSNHDWDKARKMLAPDVQVTATTTQPIMPPTNLTGVDDYMDGLIKFGQAVAPGSARVIASVGDERNALLMLTVDADLGGRKVTLPAARLYLLDEDDKIKVEQVVFFAVPD